ncbi:MAG: STAS/SEC14 domain-containing protein [Pseudomonadota bacterium]|nr:STAS/SEC14 domain-containing protein [Pseudomonadota bacterium]
MMRYDLDRDHSLLHVRPEGALEAEDFEQLVQLVDPFIEESGGLDGLIIETSKFPGWENLAAMVRHFRFVRDHHRKIRKVALVTDSAIGDLAEHIAAHFVAAQVKGFAADQLEQAKAWIAEAE